MDDHVSFPFMFKVARTENLNESENGPSEKEYETVHKVEGDTVALNVCAHSSKLSDV